MKKTENFQSKSLQLQTHIADETLSYQINTNYQSPNKKISQLMNLSRNYDDQNNNDDENYQSTKLINFKNDEEDISFSNKRSIYDMVNTHAPRCNSIQPMNQTINPRLQLYHSQEYCENDENKQNYDESYFQLMSSTSKREASPNMLMNQLIQKSNSVYINQTFDEYSNETSQDNTSRVDNQPQLITSNFSKKKNSSAFQNEFKVTRTNSKKQTENFYNALSKITGNEKINGNEKSDCNDKNDERNQNNMLDSQYIQQSKNLKPEDQQEVTVMNQSTFYDNKQNLENQKTTKFNISNLKKKEQQMREYLAIRVQQFQYFFRNIKYLSQAYKYRQMTPIQKELIHDLSFHQSKKKQIISGYGGQRLCQRIIQKVFCKTLKRLPVFNPNHFLIICLELIVFIILMIQIFILPLADSFRVNIFVSKLSSLLLFFVPSIILTFSIIIKFNTAYYRDNVLVTDRKKIFLQFLHTDLFIELISLFAIIINQFLSESFVYFFFLLRLNLIGNVLQKIDSKFSLTQRSPHLFQIIKLIFLVILLAHINGCIFNYVARDLKVSWITEKKLQDMDCVYFSFITMVTVGYGDITPISIQEKLFVISMTVYSCGAFGYIVSSIGNIFTEIAQKQATYKRQLSEIVHYMRNRNIDQDIQVQVFQYLQYLEQMDHYNHQKGEQIVQKLSPQLQSLIKKNFYYPFLQKTNILKLNFSEQTLINATLKMKELTFGPGQVIFDKNDCDNRIFYVLKGEVQLNKYKLKLSVKDEIDNCFGVAEFFSGEARIYSAKSKTVTQIVYLELSDFQQVLKEDPLEYEKFCSLREQIIYSKLVADQCCFFCKKYNHIYELCPYYTFKHKRIVIIEKSKLSIPQTRKEFDRGKKIRFKCINENYIIRTHLKAVRLNYVNNSMIDKQSMIRLIESTLFDERDIDFYRNYEAFELRFKEDSQTYYAHLIEHDKIAEEYFNVEDEINEQNSELENPQPLSSSSKYKMVPMKSFNNNQQQPTPIKNDDKLQADSSLSSLILTNYLKKQRSSNIQPTQAINPSLNQLILQNINSNDNMNNNMNNFQYDKKSLLKQLLTQKINNNNNKTNMSQQNNINWLSKKVQNRNILQNKPKNQDDEDMKNSLKGLIDFALEGEKEIQNDETSFKKYEFFGIDEFDQMKEYTRYFPKYNYSYVLSQYAKYNIKTKVTVRKKKKSALKYNSNSPSQMRKSRNINQKDKQTLQNYQTGNLNMLMNSSSTIENQVKTPTHDQSIIVQSQQSKFSLNKPNVKLENINKNIF